MASTNRVMIVDDDPNIGDLIVQVAEDLGFQTAYIERSELILETFQSFDPDLIVLDLMMPNADGVQVLRTLAKEECEAEIILFSGADARVLNTAARLAESHGLRIRGRMHKPIEINALEAMLSRSAAPSADDLEEELRVAISKADFSVHYQPKVNLKSEREWTVESVEALARWACPGRGFIAPCVFIPLAERTGLIDRLSEVVIEKAIKQANVLNQDGYSIDMAVNLSPLLLTAPDVPDRLTQQLDHYGVDSSQLIVEITESAAMADDALTMENLTRFRLKGMKLSMDDFGTGYSSLVQLYRMPFSELKIDQSFVMEIDANEEARVIVRSIVDLAHNLNLTVCAEGVETRETLDFLCSIGCDQAQGYFISKPLAEADLTRFLAENSPNQAASIMAGDRAAAGLIH
ncbi:MAG: EAL domain-containing response regulator [Rhodospirillales bacterium]|nr:EAL domain-containing response regulator [Rhodospirillales bacterium]